MKLRKKVIKKKKGVFYSEEHVFVSTFGTGMSNNQGPFVCIY